MSQVKAGVSKKRSGDMLSNDRCTGCNVSNTALIVPIHKMEEKDFKKMGIDYWTSDFSDIFSNGT